MSTKKSRQEEVRRLSAQFPRLIEWSEEDGCYVGSAPPLVGQCCHGKTESTVATQLAAIVEDLAQDVIKTFPTKRQPKTVRTSFTNGEGR